MAFVTNYIQIIALKSYLQHFKFNLKKITAEDIKSTVDLFIFNHIHIAIHFLWELYGTKGRGEMIYTHISSFRTTTHLLLFNVLAHSHSQLVNTATNYLPISKLSGQKKLLQQRINLLKQFKDRMILMSHWNSDEKLYEVAQIQKKGAWLGDNIYIYIYIIS